MSSKPKRRTEPLVLLVDDDEDTYNLYSDFLASSGFSVVGANDGVEAVSSAAQISPDLIIMDLGLPLMDGCEAARVLRNSDGTRSIPILAMSGYVQKHYVDLARQAGCDGFLAKPCPLERLLGEARRLLEQAAIGAAAASHPNERILIVEDDDDIRRSLADVLEHRGYPVALAHNGLEALEYLRSAPQPPRLILLDLMMPVMDGWQFCAAQQEDPSLATIPVVVLSAVTNLRQNAASLHVADYLPKPIELPQLLKSVERFF
jgi:CheY-like chemotaxis protein